MCRVLVGRSTSYGYDGMLVFEIILSSRRVRMARVKKYSVCLERQPHRDAVVRLRAAYRRLWLMSQALSAEVRQARMAAEATNTVQEVSS